MTVLLLAACLCFADFPSVWIFGKPLVPARSWPPEPDLQHLTPPHDCHHLCVKPLGWHEFGLQMTSTVSLRKRKGIFWIVFLDPIGHCCVGEWGGGNPLYKKTFVFFPISFWIDSSLVTMFSSEALGGRTLPDKFSAVSVVIGSFIFYVRYSEGQ